MVNLRMHQDTNIFSDDVSKTFGTIDEVPDSPSPYFAKRARSIGGSVTPGGGARSFVTVQPTMKLS